MRLRFWAFQVILWRKGVTPRYHLLPTFYQPAAKVNFTLQAVLKELVRIKKNIVFFRKQRIKEGECVYLEETRMIKFWK